MTELGIPSLQEIDFGRCNHGKNVMLQTWLPPGLKEGNALRCDDGVYFFDEVETVRLKKETKAMFDKLWE